MPTETSESTQPTIDPKDLPSAQRPRHIAIIMDGNGRWAEAQGLPRIFGHRNGIRSVRAVVEEGCRIGLGQLTLYCFSSENWKRPQRELRFLFRLLRHFLIVERSELMEQNVRLTMIGRREGLPEDVLVEYDRTAAMTAGNSGMTLCLAVNYGARAEIAEAARRLARDAVAGVIDPGSVDEAAFSSYLSTAGMPDPDLLIRTAGEMRLSNYLLWQVSYAELHVTEVLWPDFRAEHLRRAVLDYARRPRKFGGLPGRSPTEGAV
ncbi:polyprenyl diphosphate synthase [Tautonia sociabilis]|uniref:Isoprenyl transferase n=1 Tax=Tautonia sociabilis TaxID=2080755 RepID=A0A432MHF1_9BACT|nr:polyprenyl diphosphate synthase [Tautonia sociabilis]RUL86231.1 di-trans,poly-cis-decaprenylcistransferase [Tautonia sociabilis]